MTYPKIEKVKTEISKTKARIADYQVKLRALERQKTDLENEQIVALVRSEKISDGDLSALMQSFRKERSKTKPGEAVVEIVEKQGDAGNGEDD